MKLVIVWHAGGVKSYWRRFEELSKKFDQVTVIVPEKWKEGNKVVTTKSTLLTPNCRIIKVKTGLNLHGSTYFYLPKIAKILKKAAPDIIHIHEEPWSLSTFQVIALNKRFHLNAKIFIDSAAITMKKKPLFFSNMEKYAYKNGDVFFARNQEVKEILLKRGCKSPVHILPNGVDTSLFKPADSKKIINLKESEITKEKSKVISYFGRMIKGKGIYDFIDAAEYLIQSGKTDYRFLMVGSGREFERVTETIKEKRLENYFTIQEKIPAEKVPDMLNSSNLLVLPSRTLENWKEQFGRVLVEAMACGKAVIGSDSGAIPEVINDSRFVFPEGDSRAMASLIETVLSDESLYQQAVTNSRKRVNELYSWDALAGYLYDVTNQELTKETRRLYAVD